MVPAATRERIKASLSPRMMSFLVRFAVRGGTAPAGAAGRRARRYRASGLVALGAEHGRIVAQTVHRATPLAARRETLRQVMEILDGAGVAHFVVRGVDDLASAVAVSAADRPVVLRALRAAARARPFYFAEVIGQHVRSRRRGGDGRFWRTAQKAEVVRVVRHYLDSGVMFGAECGCDIEFWLPEGGMLHAPRPNRAADLVPEQGPVTLLGEESFTRLSSVDATGWGSYPTREEFAGDLLDDITFPVDVVYTWVDGDDPAWRDRRDRALRDRPPVLGQAANASRYLNRDELRYSLRSLWMFAPWVRRIWLVTDDQVPPWLDPGHPKLTVVSHAELFGGRGALPTFNSHAIESQLHRLPGLSEHFVYFNDDVFLGRPFPPGKVFHANGIAKIFPSRAKVDPGEPDVAADIPATAAGRNNRRLIQKDFGRHLTYKMKHVPHALRRSVLAEIEERYPEELARTAGNPFRDPGDVSLTSSLFQYYAYATGRAAVDSIRYMYADLSSPTTEAMLPLLQAKRDFDVFCLNDTDTDPAQFDRLHRLMESFLSQYIPIPAPWEK